MDKNKQPGISFDNIILVKESFYRDVIVPKDSKAYFNVKHNWDKKDDKKCVSELITSLMLKSDEKEVLKLESTFVGIFSIIDDSENMSIEEYIKGHSPALMLPYIREHISSITQKAGVKPVLLPPINILALINESMDNEEKGE
jgi:preprotein translocase subunit SecB